MERYASRYAGKAAVSATVVSAEVSAQTTIPEREIIDANTQAIVRGRPLLDAGVTDRAVTADITAKSGLPVTKPVVTSPVTTEGYADGYTGTGGCQGCGIQATAGGRAVSKGVVSTAVSTRRPECKGHQVAAPAADTGQLGVTFSACSQMCAHLRFLTF